MHNKKKHGWRLRSLPVFYIILALVLADADPASAAPNAEIYQILIGNETQYEGPYYKDYGSYDAMMFDITKTTTGRPAVSFTVTSHADETFENPLTTKTYVPSQYGWTHFTGMGFNCNAHYIGELRDVTGYIVLSVKMTVTGLKKPLCDSEPSGDMGSDEDIGDGDGDGDGGDGDIGGGTCDSCGIFDCPGWNNYMGQLEDIKNAIPPPPNWHEVSRIFSDAIVPRLVGETRVMLDDLLGRAPTPPTPPPQQQAPPNIEKPNNVDDFTNKEPEMQDSGVVGFDKNKIKDDAPELQYEEDDTGGFDLSVHPVDALPDVVPGGDPGIYKRDPEMMDAEIPTKPKESGDEVGSPGKPKEDFGSPSNPNDNVGNPSNPNENIGNPSNPSGDAKPPSGYMPKPK